MQKVGVPILDEHPAMLEKIPLVCKGRRGPPSTLVVELVEILWTCSVAVTGGNILNLNKNYEMINDLSMIYLGASGTGGLSK